MSQVASINAVVVRVKEKVKEQQMRLSSFQTSNEKAMQKVIAALEESENKHETKLLDQLKLTNEKLRDALESLQQAEMSLFKV